MLTKGSAALIEVVAPGHPLYGEPMSIESLTYAELGDRLGASPEAARSLARRLRLPKSRQSEIQYKPLPARSPGGHRSDVDDLNARVAQLEGELARVGSTVCRT